MRTLVRTLSVGAFFVFGPVSVAQADVISDDEAACRSAKEGDSCEALGEKGTCAAAKCHRNDYSQGVPPGSKEVDCLKCVAGEAPPEPAPEADEAAENSPNKAAPPATPASEPAGGCRVVDATPFASLGLGVLLLGFVSRRRKRA